MEKKNFNCPILTARLVGNSCVMIVDLKFFSGFRLKYYSALPLKSYESVLRHSIIHIARVTRKLSYNQCYFILFSRPNYCLSTLQIKVESLSEICCDVLNRNLCCCKGNNDYFSTLELYTYAWWKKSWKNASDVICVFFPTLVCGMLW